MGYLVSYYDLYVFKYKYCEQSYFLWSEYKLSHELINKKQSLKCTETGQNAIMNL